ncbi:MULTISPECIES: CoA-transferase subunit beta [unclassified Stygiolobus]|jgi:Acyl CoA:acetate/3-ketoacid CoA transferase, beta subunit|uniref:CoA-transferase subunit beta n=1 Tax=unclassified Stygiolobus TaxID=2824672 RepID=UPI00307F4F74
MSQVDYAIKAIAEQVEDNELVYIGLNSIPSLIASFMARDLYGKKIRIIGVAEADNPKSVEISPSTGNPFMVSNTPVFITADAFDLAQKGRLDVMFLGPVQIDKETNVNLSVIGDYHNPKVRLTGGAATAFILPLVRKAILWNLKHSKRSLVEKVDFVTGTAKYSSNKVIVVTNLGVLKYDREKKTWFITAIYENTSVEDILNNTAFEVVVSPTLRIITLRNDEREFIKRMDPYNLRSALA